MRCTQAGLWRLCGHTWLRERSQRIVTGSDRNMQQLQVQPQVQVQMLLVGVLRYVRSRAWRRCRLRQKLLQEVRALMRQMPVRLEQRKRLLQSAQPVAVQAVLAVGPPQLMRLLVVLLAAGNSAAARPQRRLLQPLRPQVHRQRPAASPLVSEQQLYVARRR